MKTIVLAAALSFIAGTALADTCSQKAASLNGAAKNSSMTKCKKDAQTACEATAKANKLAGAAFNSNVTKCVKDAVGE
jgi:hypothetical protein